MQETTKNNNNFIGRSKKLFDMADDGLNALRTAIKALSEKMIFTVVGVVGSLLHSIEMYETHEEMNKRYKLVLRSADDPEDLEIQIEPTTNGIAYRVKGKTDNNIDGTILFSKLPNDFPKNWSNVSEIDPYLQDILKITLDQEHTKDLTENWASYLSNRAKILLTTFGIGFSAMLATSLELYFFLALTYGLIAAALLITAGSLLFDINFFKDEQKNIAHKKNLGLVIGLLVLLTIAFVLIYISAILPTTLNPLIAMGITLGALNLFIFRQYLKASNTREKNNLRHILMITLMGTAIMFGATYLFPILLTTASLQFASIYILLNSVFLFNVAKSSIEYLKDKTDFDNWKELKHNAIELLGGVMVLFGILIDLRIILPMIESIAPLFDLIVIPGLLVAEITIPTILITAGIFLAYWNEIQRAKPLQSSQKSFFEKLGEMLPKDNWDMVIAVALLMIPIAVGFGMSDFTLMSEMGVHHVLMPMSWMLLIGCAIHSGYDSVKEWYGKQCEVRETGITKGKGYSELLDSAPADKLIVTPAGSESNKAKTPAELAGTNGLLAEQQRLSNQDGPSILTALPKAAQGIPQAPT